MGMICPKCRWNIKWKKEGKPEQCPKCGAKLSKPKKPANKKIGSKLPED